jgi:hypothetical protein
MICGMLGTSGEKQIAKARVKVSAMSPTDYDCLLIHL